MEHFWYSIGMEVTLLGQWGFMLLRELQQEQWQPWKTKESPEKSPESVKKTKTKRVEESEQEKASGELLRR